MTDEYAGDSATEERRGDRYDARSVSPSQRRYESRSALPPKDDQDAENVEGNNLFVSNLSIRIKDEELEEQFAKHGTVVKCQIIYDPHTRESRGFGFVEMASSTDADNALEALRKVDLDGRPLTIEKAKRSRPRNSTPGQYHGREKPSRFRRDDDRRYDRYDDRRRGDDRYDDRRRDDRYSSHRRDDRYDDRRRDDRYDDRRRDDRYDDRRRDDRYDDRRRDDRYDDRRDDRRRDDRY